MRRLLSANLSRLRSYRVFWLLFLIMFGLGAYTAFSMYLDGARYQEVRFLDENLFIYGFYVGFCEAVFCSFFFGTEYSDGTIRNKLIAGHRRGNIYCAGWFTAATAAVLMGIAFLLSYLVLGAFLLETPRVSMRIMICYTAVSFFTSIAYVSLFYMLSVLITKKSVAVLACLLTYAGLMLVATLIIARLQDPEFISGYQVTANGIEQMAPEPNPRYLQPEMRKLYQFYADFLPAGQSMQLAFFTVVHPAMMMLYSVFISAGTTVIGILEFRRKNLK